MHENNLNATNNIYRSNELLMTFSTKTRGSPEITRLGNPVTITCTVSADPGVTRIIWQIINPATNQGVNIDTSIAKYSGGTLAIPSLTINPVGESDEGNYQCLAENSSYIM
jgi:hypothetical protein